jgi:hypothetical protein
MSFLTLWLPKETARLLAIETIAQFLLCGANSTQGLTRTDAKRPVKAPPHFSAAISTARR